MTTEEYKAYLQTQAEPFKNYCKKIRGWGSMPHGMEAVIVYQDFEDWKEEEICRERTRRIASEVIDGLVKGK